MSLWDEARNSTGLSRKKARKDVSNTITPEKKVNTMLDDENAFVFSNYKDSGMVLQIHNPHSYAQPTSLSSQVTMSSEQFNNVISKHHNYSH